MTDSPAPAAPAPGAPAPTAPAPGRPPSQARGVWAMRDRPGVLWLVLAAVVALVHQWVPEATWLMTHLVLLGALTHSAMVWSAHFASTILKTPPSIDDRTQQTRRLTLLMAGTAAVLVGVPLAWWWLVVTGAAAVSAAVLWHGFQLWRRLRKALPGRFRITVRYYLAAAVCLPVGAGLGATLARGLSETWHSRLLAAHVTVMVLGWLGLTMAGTLVTLWPTMLRTRMDADAERRARQALPGYVAALLLVVAGALAGLAPLVAVGLLTWVGAMGWWGRSLIGPLRRRPPTEFAPLSVGAALLWLVGGLLTAAVLIGRPGGDGLEGLGAHAGLIATVAAVGFGLQLLTGALTYLVPSVLGGGASVVRAGQWWLERWALSRLVVINAGLVLCLLPVPSWVRVSVSVLVLVALAAFVPLMLAGIRAAVAARRAKADAQAGPTDLPSEPAPERPQRTLWSSGQLVAALVALAMAVSVGVGLDGGVSSNAASLAGAAPATGETTTVRVEAREMSYVPDTISVRAGDRLVIELVNTDTSDSHDLVFENGERTARLAAGESATVDVGVVGVDTEGWCSVVGHRRMGMVLTIDVQDGPAPARVVAAGGRDDHGDDDHGDDEPGGHDHAAHDDEDTEGHGASGAEAETPAYDPVLPSLRAGSSKARTHRLTLSVEEVELEVAPGVWQKRWTFGGQVPAPTLHGRVGDRFVVTVVNNGEMTHSIDFHSGERAPDRVMVGIAPGESLTYRFTATRAGVWMYHCSTAPMSSHIAAGMAGAVVIRPRGLPDVDREFLLVQSEVFLAGSSAKGSADMVDDAAVAAEQPDLVVFNGRADQYAAEPLTARVGERVRFWVLDAGPNRASSFHVVGDQFDTVWTEGAYQLRPDEPGGGGAQVLPLLAAQGGFVELEFDEPGRYPFVSHIMVDAERGAAGVVAVSR